MTAALKSWALLTLLHAVIARVALGKERTATTGCENPAAVAAIIGSSNGIEQASRVRRSNRESSSTAWGKGESIWLELAAPTVIDAVAIAFREVKTADSLRTIRSSCLANKRPIIAERNEAQGAALSSGPAHLFEAPSRLNELHEGLGVGSVPFSWEDKLRGNFRSRPMYGLAACDARSMPRSLQPPSLAGTTNVIRRCPALRSHWGRLRYFYEASRPLRQGGCGARKKEAAHNTPTRFRRVCTVRGSQ